MVQMKKTLDRVNYCWPYLLTARIDAENLHLKLIERHRRGGICRRMVCRNRCWFSLLTCQTFLPWFRLLLVVDDLLSVVFFGNLLLEVLILLHRCLSVESFRKYCLIRTVGSFVWGSNGCHYWKPLSFFGNEHGREHLVALAPKVVWNQHQSESRELRGLMSLWFFCPPLM